jgi:hypothetical protein
LLLLLMCNSTLRQQLTLSLQRLKLAHVQLAERNAEMLQLVRTCALWQQLRLQRLKLRL